VLGFGDVEAIVDLLLANAVPLGAIARAERGP